MIGCKLCMFSIVVKEEELECRKYPPTPTFDSRLGLGVVIGRAWPQVDPDDSCFQFEKGSTSTSKEPES